MSDYAVLIQNCETRKRKITNAKKLYVLSNRFPFNRAQRFEPTGVKDFKKDREYGYREDEQMVKYYIILMAETIAEAQNLSKTTRHQPPKRRSVGPCSVPFKTYKIKFVPKGVTQKEAQQSKAEKVNDLKKLAKRTEETQNKNISAKIKERLNAHQTSEPLHKKQKTDKSDNKDDKDSDSQDSTETDLGENAVNKNNSKFTDGSDEQGENLYEISDDQNKAEWDKVDVENENTANGKPSEEEDKVPPTKTVVASKGSKGSKVSEETEESSEESEESSEESDDDAYNFKLCKSCYATNSTKMLQLKEEASKITKKYENMKKRVIEVQAQNQKLEEISSKLSKLPGEMKKSAEQCWASSLPKFIVSAEKEFETVEVPDGHFYVGAGKVISATDLLLCADQLTMRGRVGELCDLIWEKQSHLYAPSGRREKYGHLINVLQVPDIHVKAMRVILKAMVWDDETEGQKNTESKLKEDIRKHTQLKCTVYIAEKFPLEYKEIQDKERQKRKSSKKTTGPDSPQNEYD